MAEMGGKVALVTGAASGIGRAAAERFAHEDAIVVVADCNAQGGEETAARIRSRGGQAVFYRTDVTEAAQVTALVTQTMARFGRLDYALNNAGGGTRLAITGEAHEADFDASIALNLRSIWLALREELRVMARQGFGAIVNTSSVAGLTACADNAPYAAAKHGVIGLTKTAAMEYAPKIRVNAVCPGLTATPLTEGLARERPDLLERLLPPLGRMAQPSEIAEAAIWLCSDQASFVTGHALVVDGGYMARG